MELCWGKAKPCGGSRPTVGACRGLENGKGRCIDRKVGQRDDVGMPSSICHIDYREACSATFHYGSGQAQSVISKSEYSLLLIVE